MAQVKNNSWLRFPENEVSAISESWMNPGDTVIFDMGFSYQVASEVEVPVYFHSPGIIHSLDFQLQFNYQKMELDTVIILCPNLNFLYYLNPQDSVFRFTSYNFNQLASDSILIKLRFHVFNGPACSGDLFNLISWLNGNICTSEIINCVISGNQEHSDNFFTEIYPNPATDYVCIRTLFSQLIIIDSLGRLIFERSISDPEESVILNTSEYKSGIYTVLFLNRDSVIIKKMVIAD